MPEISARNWTVITKLYHKYCCSLHGHFVVKAQFSVGRYQFIPMVFILSIYLCFCIYWFVYLLICLFICLFIYLCVYLLVFDQRDVIDRSCEDRISPVPMGIMVPWLVDSLWMFHYLKGVLNNAKVTIDELNKIQNVTKCIVPIIKNI